MESSSIAAALVTTPTILWLYGRLASILRRNWRSLRFHLGQSLGTTTTTTTTTATAKQGTTIKRTSNLSFAVHVITGLGVATAAPYLAYLIVCVPTIGDAAADDDKIALTAPSSPHYVPLVLISTLLLTANASVLWLLPHPDLYKLYDCANRRAMVRALSLLYAGSVQFVAMTVAVLAMLVHPSLFRQHQQQQQLVLVVRTALMGATLVLYAWTLAICACEFRHVPWEDCYPMANRGGRAGSGLLLWPAASLATMSTKKSTLTLAYVRSDDLAKNVQYGIMFSVGAVAGLQNAVMLVRWWSVFYGGIHNRDDEDSNSFLPPPVSIGQETFYVLVSNYLTLVMSVGFFTVAQVTFSMHSTQDEKQREMLQRTLTVDVVVSQALPLLLLAAVGPQWCDCEVSLMQFYYHWFLWVGK